MTFLKSYAIFLILGLTTVHSQEKPKLRFNENGRFKIVNFADLHYGEAPDSFGPMQDTSSTRVMKDILSWETPDFVVFTGDLITGEHMFPNATEYIDLLLQPVISSGYRWASTYGNHDIGANISREAIFATEQKHENCYTQSSDASMLGITNYYLLVYPPESVDPTNDNPALVLWFFDSRGGKNATHNIEASVDESVVSWFQQANSDIAETYGQIPALAFFHIPTLEYEPVQDTIFDNPECTGLVDDTVTPQERDTGFMRALIDAGTIKTAFVGHDHGNAWCCYYETLELCYNRHSGYGGYGEWTRGSRIVEAIYDDPWGNYVNYIRLENGIVLDHFPNPN